mgnify:CR=1 FL=1
MKNRLAILFFLIISSCSSKFSFYEAEGFASISKRNLIITSLPKGTLLKITNHENKNSKIIKTDEKSNTLGSRIILLPMEIYKNLNLDKKYPLVYLESVRKNKSFVAKEAKTFKAERNVQNKIKLNKVEIVNLDKESNSNKKIYLNFGPFYFKIYAETLIKTINLSLKNKDIILRQYQDKNYTVTIGPLNNLNEYDKIYLSLKKIGLIGYKILII